MPTFFYILFFYSGMIKFVFVFYGIKFPVDFTVLSVFLLFMYIFYDYILLKNKFKITKKYILVLSFLLIFYCWIFISLLYTPSKGYSIIKALYFSTNLIAFAYPLFVRNFNVKSFIKSMIFISIIFALWYMRVDLNAASYIRNSPQFNVYASFYLIASFLLGINVLICLISQKKLFGNRRNDLIIAVVSLALMLMIRGRGPLLFVIVILIIYYIRKILLTRKKSFLLSVNGIIKTSIILFVLIFTVLIIFIRFENQILSMITVTFDRLQLLLNGVEHKNAGHSVNVRLEHLTKSVNLIFNNIANFFAGYGIGSYGILTTGKDIKDYPHNILLEIFVELGLIGLISFLLYLFFNFIYYKKHNLYISYYLILFVLLNMLKSSSLVDIRIYFTFFALFLINPKKNILKADEN